MLAGQEISMLDALNVALSSMVVVFIVLFILFAVVKFFPVFFKTKKPAKPAETAAEQEDETELLMVLWAAIQAYEGGQNDPLIRNVGSDHKIKADIVATNPFVRDCE